MENISKTVRRLLKGCSHSHIEVEARIRIQLVNTYSVQLLKDNLCMWKKSEYFEKRKISKHNRKCTYRSRLYGVGVGEHICKSSIEREEINDMWCTVHVSTETPMPSMQHALDKVQQVKVTRHRTTIHGYYIDIIAHDSRSHDDTSNGDEMRVEIEACDARCFESISYAEEMMNVVKIVCTALQGTQAFLPFYDWKTLMHVSGSSFGPFCIDKNKIQKPRTMTIDALLSIADTLQSGWAATPKVDGVRMFLVTVNGSVFSLVTAKEVAYVHSCPTSIGNVTIIDCEYAQGMYHAFDIPVYDGAYCGYTTLDDRITRLENVVGEMAGINIRVKPYKTFRSFEELTKLYGHFSECFDIDGLIFAPYNGDYMQPIPKWKMHSTVDLEVKQCASGELILITCDGFTVNIDFTFDPGAGDIALRAGSQTDVSSQIGICQFEALYLDVNTLDNISSNQVGLWEFQFDNEKLIAKRRRPDKPQANSKHIVDKNMFSCVPGTLFTGSGFYLMRKYHNRTKAQLISDAYDFKAVIMDIGTGQGGDIGKWKRAKRVYCVEPNEYSMREMLERCDNDERMIVLNAKLSDINPDDIHDKVDIFTAFFCMNQWGDEDFAMLKYVILNKGSTKCRLLVTALTHPKHCETENFKIDMKPGTTNTYNVSIYDTRIVDIDEIAVLPDDLTKLAKKCGMHQVKHERLDTNDFMTWEEKRLSSMYSLFVYSK